MNISISQDLIATTQKEEKTANTDRQQQLITVACLTIFPLIYLIGKTVVSAL